MSEGTQQGKPNVVFLIGFAPNDKALSANPITSERYADERRFYSCNQEYSYLKYVGLGSKEKLDYVEYSGDNEKSNGIFDADGILSKKQKRKLQDALRKTDSNIWHGVISFKKEFGDCYVKTQADADRLMNTEFPRFLKDAGLDPKNITWYAGFHTNTENPHIHFSFFENEPSRYRANDNQNLYYSDGVIPTRCIRYFKIRAEQRLTDMTAQISKARQETSDLMRDILFTNENRRKYNEEIAKEILELKDLLPKDGRLSYDSENMAHLRPKVRKIVDAMIKSDVLLFKRFTEFCGEISKKDEDTKRILIANGVDKTDFPKYLKADKYLNDLYRRLGNHVINAARYFKRREHPAKKRTIQKRISKNARLGLLAQCAYLRINVEEEAFRAFREYLRKLQENEREMRNELEEPEFEME